ncbi:hypothetical protein ACLKA7_007646 [Drosophila subpalustris]
MSNLNTKPYPKKQQGISNAKSGSLKKPTLVAASTSKSGQSATVASEMVTMPADLTKNATSEMVTMPAGQANGSNLSADWLKKVEWANSVIPNWQQSSRALAAAKRQRSQEVPTPTAKKSRVQPGRSFAQIAKERVLIGVLDRGNPDGRIPRSQWKVVSGNVKVIACDDNRSADLYKAAVATVGEVYQGAKLAAVDWEEIPVRPRARMWFPSTIKEPEQLLKMLQRCNPSLPTHDWRVAKIEESPGPTHQAVIILNKESLAPIDAAGGELNFGFSSVFIRVYKSDAAVSGAPSDKPVVEDIAAELEAPERPEMDRYTSDASSLTRDLRKLWQAGDLEVTSDIASDDEDANVTVVEGMSTDVSKDSADKPPPLYGGLCGPSAPPGWRRSRYSPDPGTLDEGGGCQIVAYADDVAVIFTGKYPQTLCDLMTVKLNRLATWADKCGLGKPTAQIYYNKLIAATNIDATWNLVRFKVRHLKTGWQKAKAFSKSTGAGLEEGDVETTIRGKAKYKYVVAMSNRWQPQ